MRGEVRVRVGSKWMGMQTNETVLVPAGSHHGLYNTGTERAIVQQVSGPKPWDARFQGPHPRAWAKEHAPWMKENGDRLDG
jgi:Cupin domain